MSLIVQKDLMWLFAGHMYDKIVEIWWLESTSVIKEEYSKREKNDLVSHGLKEKEG